MQLKREINWFLIRKKLSQVRLVFLDVDGVLTNGNLIYDEKGLVSKVFSVRDGLGIKLLQEFGIEIAIVSGGLSGSTEARAKDLKIKYCYTGVKDKSKIVDYLIGTLCFQKSETLFLGDDLNDLIVKDKVGLFITSKDGSHLLRKKSSAVLKSNGGGGAVRELAERILKTKNGWCDIKKGGWKDIN